MGALHSIYGILRGVTQRMCKDLAVLLFPEGWSCQASLALEECLVYDIRNWASCQDF